MILKLLILSKNYSIREEKDKTITIFGLNEKKV
jgi:hypothetical protein